ncbi:MAG TPA: sensor histidine kinase [Opitutaceae bacterium]|nr:sensor histidine kinase [Opitutaceae bacterium]
MRVPEPKSPLAACCLSGGLLPRRCRAAVLIVSLWSAVMLGFQCGAAVEAPIEGAPSTTLYPLDQIGCTSRELQLLHDSYGRVAVAQQGELFILNDATWQTTPQATAPGLSFHRVVCGADGEIYYGAFGSWGILRRDLDGAMSPIPSVTADAPPWVHSCDFRDVLWTRHGVLFWGQDGIVFRENGGGAQRFFPIKRVASVFPLQGRLVVATFDDGMFYLDIATGSWAPAAIGAPGLAPVIASAGDGERSLLLATTDRRLLALRGGRLEFVQCDDGVYFPGPTRALTELAGGGFVASLPGYGLWLISEDGCVGRVFDSPEFRSALALESAEPGVLWAVTEQGVLKIMLRQPFTEFGREQGILLHWPQIVRWQGRTIVSSGGKVFEAYAAGAGRRGRFRLLAGQPDNLGWGIATVGRSLLIGNGQGVFAADSEGEFSLVYPGINVARLVALNDDTCLVIGADRIAAIQRQRGGWVECTASVPGFGYPYVVHGGNGTAWVELGLNRVAQVALTGDRLQVRVFEEFAWAERSWVNVSIVGTTAVLSAAGRWPMFLDDATLAKVEAPELRQLVARAPYRLERFARDEEGTLWVSHARGLFPARLVDGKYEPDFAAFGGINESTPLVWCPAGGGVWATTDNSLFRLQSPPQEAGPRPIRPVLVALRDTRAGVPLAWDGSRAGALGVFPYAQNSLQLEFFAGSYSWGRPFWYEYRLGSASWVRANAGSSVFLPDLREGVYSIEVRATDTLGQVGEIATYRVSIAAPWYRSWLAFVAYPLLAILMMYLAIRYSAYRQRVRLAELEQQVDRRTAELRTAMECLREETTANATLAERNRLAAEIHDSLEQGFAGLFLQLESTSRLSACAGPVKAGLAAAIQMVTYCRDELRNAVRGLHSPVLRAEPLESALQRVVARLAPLAPIATVRLEGTPRRIEPAIEHHLLRIAQEALGNVVKHAEATRVEVVLCFGTGELRLSIHDDGRGFDPRAVAGREDSHLGLPGFELRARNLGGTISVESAPGKGTTVCVVVPAQ